MLEEPLLVLDHQPVETSLIKPRAVGTAELAVYVPTTIASPPLANEAIGLALLFPVDTSFVVYEFVPEGVYE